MTKKIVLITTNPGKVVEIQEHLKKFDIEVVGKHIEIPEIRSDDQEEVAKEKVKLAVKTVGEPVISEDTGIYFEAYKNFPGTNSKWLINKVGYEGVLKLLEGKSRKAYFKTVIAYCEPEGNVQTFTGICKGDIIVKIRGKPHPRLPYDSIFVPEGKDRTFAEMTIEERNQLKHRAKAAEAFAKWFNSKVS
jgi:XTP/dITP diphosphohydrolase